MFQLNTLQGSVVEYTAADAANKKTGSGSGGGGGPGIKDVLEYICPKLPLSCLHVAQNSEKVRFVICSSLPTFLVFPTDISFHGYYLRVRNKLINYIKILKFI